MRGPHLQNHVIHWSRCHVANQRRYISTFTRPKDPRLRMRGPHPQVTWHIKHLVTWQIKDVISPLSQDLWIPNLAGWWLRMKRPHPESHLTDQSSGQVTNQKYFIFIFTRHKAHKLSRVVTRTRRPHPTCHVTLRSRRYVTTIQ